MSQENQSCLRFSLEESLWFRKGQEVEELISISLDPDITIQENDQYVTIRGSLELTGEYKSYEESQVSEEEGFASQKFVERVAEREGEETCEFSHRFPVDITIPNNRIQSIYDIDVLVESFDYSLPERSCLKLSAELTISGLYGTEQQEEEEIEAAEPEFEVLHRSETEEDEVESIQAAYQSNYQDSFLFETEARKPLEEESVDALPKFPTFNYQPQQNFYQEEEEENYQPAWSFQEARGGEKKAVVEEEKVVAEKEPVQKVEVKEEEEEVSAEEESSSSSDNIIHKLKKKMPIKKKSMTLTEFFARKDEGAEQARLKMCIVQKGDTVDSLAERYDVSISNLLRVNQLELNQDVYEGQVLYIPATLAKK
ncbi:stage VI sporulation protein D [Paenibacillus sp. BSR1-1]|uniref:stage VI sporulation protein D n=1 Tax=Paenibacillus sp. BSR1-1 TaxID=3020845 RepID=UPI0025B02AA2|nr:stage VI sporulation protein D [Paenibacillus sp. BSR1-1]MDN3018495.1 stage VI sporulation protein D [Paenibacillus sp. BSR1-1]